MSMLFKTVESRPARAGAPVTEWFLIGAATTSTVLELTVKVRALLVWEKEPGERKMKAEAEHAINGQREGGLTSFPGIPMGPGLGCNGLGECLAVVGGSTPSAAWFLPQSPFLMLSDISGSGSVQHCYRKL